MASSNTGGPRTERLRKLFAAFTNGRRSVSSITEAQHFLESAQAQASPSRCLEDLATAHGLESVRKSVRVSSSPSFLCSYVLPFISYLADSDARAIFEGTLLQQVVATIVEPTTVWRAITRIYLADEFPDKIENTKSFAWLSLLIATHSGAQLTASTELSDILDQRPLISVSDSKIKSLGYQIQKALQLRFEGSDHNDPNGPGGRHDNDFVDFRKISVYPTNDEFASTLAPYYRRAEEIKQIPSSDKARNHLDNQFRLLREDMLAELREDIRIALGKVKNKKKQVQILGKLQPLDINTGDAKRSRSCTFIFTIGSGLEQFCKKTPDQRTRYLKENTSFLRHDAFGALSFGDQIIGFAFVVREANNLIRNPPCLQLRLANNNTFQALFSPAKPSAELRFTLVNTPIFAYEPVLNRLKSINQIPLDKDILQLQDIEDGDIANFKPSGTIRDLLSKLEDSDHESLFIDKKHFQLDQAQFDAMKYALRSPLSVIQGPPGTGKSFIGALVAKILLLSPRNRLLILSYTNHALDQFLEDLMDIGIPSDIMTRLGSKSTTKTASLSFEAQFRTYKSGGRPFSRVAALREELNSLRGHLVSAYEALVHHPSLQDILDFLEFSEAVDSQDFWDAFQVRREEDGFSVAGKHNKAITEVYLMDQWCKGKGPGIFQQTLSPSSIQVWHMSPADRSTKYYQWIQAWRAEQIETFQEALNSFNNTQKEIDDWFDESKCEFIKTKRVVGCTTTAAAKYASLIKAARSDCVLVEEAGEILEAHVLTSLTPDTRQLVLIGDHKQLRPKCNNYALSVEQGDGYDLNRSMFERLVLEGYPYATLQKQHRMVPEISQIVRQMTYPDLLDASKTEKRPQILGVQGRVHFINHNQLETTGEGLRDRSEPGQSASKENPFEAHMVLSIVRYLVLQGYKSDEIVVLTPYLGQLRRLRETLKEDGDPLLNEMDAKELIRAGLLSTGGTKDGQGRLRLSTVDNYQGEESDIVIASLTRSNDRGEIGFMKSPERLNVLVSRARNTLIMIGNMHTFLASRQGRDCWVPFFNMMKKENYLRDGLPVRCEQHPERTQILCTPNDFTKYCPDGGCAEPCNAPLNCGLHKCPRSCHKGASHTKIPCPHLLEMKCVKMHNFKATCSASDKGCPKCRKEEEDLRRRMKRDLEIEKVREEREAAYRREVLEIQDEVERQKKLLRYRQEEAEQVKDIEKLRAELTAVKEDNAKHQAVADKEEKKNKASPTAKSRVPRTHEPGSAGEEWQLMKRDEGAKSDELDELMDMIGLEDVKAKFLSIKAEYDTSIRQGVVRGKDRFGCSMLGNPGTGKTTVARLYAKFLTSVGVVAGQGFRETSGSKLANGGVAGCQKLIDEVLGQGGGVIFIDEAYQLSSGNSSGGLAVLDFLLAEVENLTSKVCFILAGYAKQMESFFAHNPGIPSRFPIEMKFADYSDSELLLLLENKIHAVYQGRAKAEDGIRGLYCRIIARRLGRGRGKEGFGNARAVENVLAVIRRRQASRLRRQRRMKPKPDDLLFTKEDLIGPEPSGALSKSKAWSKLQQLTGLQTVKDSIKSLVSSIQANYQREINEEPLIEYTLNRVFLGNPGTGKTTVAKLYGAILVDLTLLSNGEVVVKNPSDFVGAYVGHSESQTNGILAATVGKVLVIDEAYGLYEGKNGSSTGFKTAVVDTIVSTVQNVPGDDRCVLLLGYKDQMEEMFQNVNPGLSRRFPISSAFTFEDFSTSELSTILDLKLGDRGYSVDATARSVALDVLERARSRPNFGNAGEIDILLNDAVLRHQKRLAEGKPAHRTTFEACDIDEDYDRLGRGGTNIDQLFDGTVGCEKIVSTLKGYQNTVRSMKALDCDPKESIPFNFLFRGPPGTGKTTTARKMAQVFYDAGFLSEVKVLDCSASDLIGEYIGHTGPKVLQLMDKALGRVLLVDEAYRLAEGRFAQEALDEIVDAITKEKYYKKLIIILAGYENDINRLLNANPGLTSRFPEVIDFAEMKPDDCFNLLEKKCKRHKDNLEKNGKGSFDMTCLLSPTTDFRSRTCQLFRTLSAQAGWANARDVETLSGALVKKVVEGWAGDPTGVMQLSEQMITAEMHKMAKERASRAGHNSRLTPVDTSNNFPQQDLPIRPSAPINIPPPAATVPTTTVATPDKAEQSSNESSDECPTPCSDEGGNPLKQSIRDAGVTDEVWEELQRDAEAEEQREKEHEAKVKAKEKAADEATRRRILRELIEDDERRKRAEEMKKKLAKSGRCPMGYAWIQQANGWRCAGGSHFVSELELK